MADVQFTNNALSTLASGITDADLSLDVAAGEGALFPSLTGAQYFNCTLINSSNQYEYVKVTARAGDTFTIERAQQGTAARVFSAGDRVEHRLTAGCLAAFVAAYLDTEADDTVNAHTEWQHDKEIRFGTNNEFAVVYASGAGTLLIKHDTGGDDETCMAFNQDGSAEFYYDDTKMLETTSSGAKLSGINTVLDLNKGQVKLHAEAGGSDHTVSGPVTELTAGQSFSFSQVGFCNSNGKINLADADLSNAMPVMVLAAGTIASNASGVFALPGCFVRDDSWSWTVGGLIYASTTGGELTQTAPSGAGDQVQVVGVATHATRMLFAPDKTLVEIK